MPNHPDIGWPTLGIGPGRRMMKLNRLAIVLAAALISLTAACGHDGPEAPTGSGSATAQQPTTAQGIIINHNSGTTELDGPAQRIVVLDLGALDTLRALGLSDKIVGLPKSTKLPKVLDEFNDPKYADVGSLTEPNIAAITELNPDLVIAGFRSSALIPDLMAKLPTIDITYAAKDDFLDGFSSATKLIAQAVGKEDEAETKLAILRKDIEAARQHPDPPAKALVLLVAAGKISVVQPPHRFDLLYDDLGMVPAIEEKADEPQASEAAPSFEAIRQANPDVIYLLDRDVTTGQPVAQILDNELVHSTNAWQNNRVYYLDTDRWYLLIHGLDNVSELLRQAADGA